MNTEIVKINPSEYGMEETKAADIAAQFKPMLDKMVELEAEFNEVQSLPIELPTTAAAAKAVRLKYVKVRTGTAEIHKQQKAFYLSAGRYVDGWKNAQLFASQGIEDKLEYIENYAANLEKERLAKLQSEREAELLPYMVENVHQLNLGSMSDDVWNAFLVGTKAQHEAKIEAERLAEEQRIAAEKKAEAEREAQRIENERLKKEAEEMQKKVDAALAVADEQRKAAEKKLADEKAKADAALKAEQDKAEKARKDAEAIAAKEREAAAEALRKAQDELKAKADAEAKAEADRLAKIEAELAMDDTGKLQSLIADLNSLKTKYAFKSKGAKAKYSGVCDLIDKIVTYIAK